jgi:hypothetical protein
MLFPISPQFLRIIHSLQNSLFFLQANSPEAAAAFRGLGRGTSSVRVGMTC